MIFRILLPLATFVALASAGARTLTASDSRQFLELFRRYCGSGSGQSQEGNTVYWCKLADGGPITYEINHPEEDVRGGENSKQVIFVQPPAYNYIHNVGLRGPGSSQETEVYVLPATADHKLNLNDNRDTSTKAGKPSIYYLANDQAPGSGGSQGGNRPLPGRLPGPSQGNDGFRPSAPPPISSQPDVTSGGYVGQQQPGGNVGGQQFYGAPSINPRNQRNIAAVQVRSHYRTPYATL